MIKINDAIFFRQERIKKKVTENKETKKRTLEWKKCKVRKKRRKKRNKTNETNGRKERKERLEKRKEKTRPDTPQSSRGQLGRGHNEIIARNSKIFVTYRPTQQGVESRVRD